MAPSDGGFTSDECEPKSKKLCRKMKQLDRLNELWVFLPCGINDEIIKKVPLEDLLRWRPVCKKWNSLIMSGAQSSRRFMSNIPLVVRSDHCSLASVCAYNQKLKEWYPIDLSFLLPTVARVSEERTLIECRFITGGRMGLLFMLCTFRVNTTVQNSIVVSNPLTKKSKEVILLDERRGGHVWVICDDQQLHYKLIVLHRDDPLHNVYDSISGSWSSIPGPQMDPYCIYSAVSSNGHLYFLKRPGLHDLHRYPIICKYDPSSNLWSEMYEVPHHIGPDSPRLVETGGQLLYVARTFTSDQGRLSWCFYKMDDSETEGNTRSKEARWVKVREMPKEIYSQLNLSVMSAPIYREIRCIGEGDNIYFVGLECTCQQDGVKRLTNRGVKLIVVAHNYPQNCWTWFTDHVDPDARFWHWETNSIRLISFQPSLVEVE